MVININKAPIIRSFLIANIVEKIKLKTSVDVYFTNHPKPSNLITLYSLPFRVHSTSHSVAGNQLVTQSISLSPSVTWVVFLLPTNH